MVTRSLLELPTLVGLAILFLVAMGPMCLGQTQYAVTNLSALGMSQVRGLDNQGQVVGNNGQRALLFSGGSMIDLGTLGGSTSVAYAINDSGLVVGSSLTATNVAHVFVSNGGGMSDFGTFSNRVVTPADINNNGEVVGSFSGTYGPAAVMYIGGAWTNVLHPLFSYHSWAKAINSRREILVDVRHPTTGVGGTYLVIDGVMTAVGFATAINESGQVVGANQHAFLYSGGADGVTTDLGTLGGASSAAYAINNNGQIVGSSTTSNGATRPFIYSGGVMRDLGSIADLIVTSLEWDTSPGALRFTYTNAMTSIASSPTGTPIAINDQGQILFSGGLLLTPIAPVATSAKLYWATNVGISAKISNTPIFTHIIPAGFTGASAPVQVSASKLQNRPTNATHVLLVLNPDNLMPESNTNNNTATLNITLPDILASDLAWNTNDGGLHFAYTVQPGTIARVTTTAELFWANGTAISNKISSAFVSHSIPANFEGQSSNITVSASTFSNPPTNATHVLLVVDSPNLVGESSENNNVAAVAFPRPDLSPIYFGWAPVGNDLEFSYSVQTGRTAIAATTAKFFWANGPAVSNLLSTTPIFTTNIPAGASGQSSNITASATNLYNPPTNATHVLLIVDPDNLVIEGNETNNVTALSLSCCGEGLFTGQISPDASAYGWSANFLPSEDDGLVLTNLSLGARYVAQSISVPYFTLLTTNMVQAGATAMRGELRINDSPETNMRSRLVDFQTNNPSPGRFTVQATYRVDNIPNSPGSSLCIFQRYEFLNKEASQPLEPSEQLDAQVCRPVVSYCFTSPSGDAIRDISFPQRRAFWLDKKLNNSTAVFRDLGIAEASVGIGLKGYLGVVTPLAANPLPSETSGTGFIGSTYLNWFNPIRRGPEPYDPGDPDNRDLWASPTALNRLNWWDNIHISFADSIQEPVLDYDNTYWGPIPRPPHAASEAIHMHWRWAQHADYVTLVPGSKWKQTGGQPLVPAGSNQDLKFAVVLLKANETDPVNYTNLVDNPPESLAAGRQVVWLEGIGHQNRDELFGFGFGLEDHIHYLTNSPPPAHPELSVQENATLEFSGKGYNSQTRRMEVEIRLASTSSYALLSGAAYVVFGLPDPSISLVSTPTGYTTTGKPFFRFESFGRDGVLSPKSSNLATGEKSQDSFTIVLQGLPNADPYSNTPALMWAFLSQREFYVGSLPPSYLP